jgi:flagellar hook-length control protein FliK
VIRLDPPMMGSIEVVIRHEAGNLQVQLNATHGEVQRQLQAIGDSLRQDLAHRQYTDVSVLVPNGARDGEGRQRPRQPVYVQEEPGRALAEGGEEPAAFSLQRDRI